MEKKQSRFNLDISIVDLLVIAAGTAIYSFGIVFFNIYNHLADGGVTGITLILRALFHIDPAYSTILVNIPLFAIGYRFLGKKDMFYTLYGTIVLAVFLWIWQRVPIVINLDHDLLLSAIGAGLFGGFGCGIIYRFGGTTGGVDIVARLFERFKGVQMGTDPVNDRCLGTVVVTHLSKRPPNGLHLNLCLDFFNDCQLYPTWCLHSPRNLDYQ
jgi:uncharacterized membrane-anchored protein YitT (DUF2179 family)